MSNDDHDSLPTPYTRLSGYVIPPMVPTTPHPPSPTEAKHYNHGLPSKPRLVARSSADPWVEPTGLEAYLRPKELRSIGRHPLQAVWEDRVGPTMIEYMGSMGVQWTSLDPVRIGYASEPSLPVIVWIGVLPGSLSADDGVKVAVHCKGVLSDHGIGDVHVEIRESEVFSSARLYKPVSTTNATARVLEPFSTALGLPISPAATPHIEGTGGFYVSDPCNPGKLYLVTTRHILFHPDENANELYEHNDSSQPGRNVLLFGDAAIAKHIEEIEFEIANQDSVVDALEKQLETAKRMNRKDAEEERQDVQPLLDRARRAVVVLNSFLMDICRDWKERETRVLGHVVLSPPISFNVGVEGFTEDWAMVEINNSIVDSTNFVGNAIDLGLTIPAEFTRWMYPHQANPPSFKYPDGRLLRISGTIPDEEMWRPSSKTLEHDNDPCIMVIKRGYASGLTVGRLNGIRSFTRLHCKGKPDETSREICVLPRNSKSNAFSELGDSGAVVVDGKGRIAGLLTSGGGSSDSFDCTYATSINFLLNRMSKYGIKANLLPSLGP
ncbi:hypothetical protein M408DRAFT_26795 [Serendipita vermifera MAFF 305830]|uniref:Peptidase S1 domain-containing protein n=1 Tax=Serendipita vermifera MAFF 305830 TaxID=933852 RepID=A0A0C3AXG7_SERVB|nr:hypothetical protein M408DRAFT_26795 [Serendipita vermifera MAFF 305830]